MLEMAMERTVTVKGPAARTYTSLLQSANKYIRLRLAAACDMSCSHLDRACPAYMTARTHTATVNIELCFPHQQYVINFCMSNCRAAIPTKPNTSSEKH